MELTIQTETYTPYSGKPSFTCDKPNDETMAACKAMCGDSTIRDAMAGARSSRNVFRVDYNRQSFTLSLKRSGQSFGLYITGKTEQGPVATSRLVAARLFDNDSLHRALWYALYRFNAGTTITRL